jgi:hypothetical protein
MNDGESPWILGTIATIKIPNSEMAVLGQEKKGGGALFRVAIFQPGKFDLRDKFGYIRDPVHSLVKRAPWESVDSSNAKPTSECPDRRQGAGRPEPVPSAGVRLAAYAR